jgi:hypothetical protein
MPEKRFSQKPRLLTKAIEINPVIIPSPRQATNDTNENPAIS